MKQIIVLMLLVLACGNPMDSTESEVTEYTIQYTGTCSDTVPHTTILYNPETASADTVGGMGGDAWNSIEYVAESGQTLWAISEGEMMTTAIIVDGETVAESTTADSVYVEYTLQ